MPFCSNCGAKVNEEARFCESCGIPIAQKKSSNGSTRQQEFTGKVYKCPNCGEVLNSFTAVCSSCGYELRGAKASTSVSEFASKLEHIEAQRKPEKKSGSLISILYGSDGRISSTDEQKISLIRSYSVPNTKEDVLEFMILASSNINFKLYGLGDKGVITASQKEVSDAWFAKMEQAYEKAKLMFEDKQEFDKIETIYTKTQKKLKKKKLEIPALIGGIIGFPIIIIILCLISPGPSVESKIEAREYHLDYLLEQIEDDIASGKYDDAKNKAYTLTFDKDLNEKKSEYWKDKQDDILEQIKEASGDNSGNTNSKGE